MKCLECNKELKQVNALHLRIHNLSLDRYLDKFPEQKTEIKGNFVKNLGTFIKPRHEREVRACRKCQKQFVVRTSLDNKFCSQECYWTSGGGFHWKNHSYINKLCEVCGQITRNKKFCSVECRSIGMEGIDCSGGYHQGMLGKHWNQNQRDKMEAIEDPWWRFQKGMVVWNKGLKGFGEGRQHTEETKKILSEIRKQNNPGGFKKGCVSSIKGQTKDTHPGVASMAKKKKEYFENGGKVSIGRAGFYASDLGHIVRSMWEANIARAFRFMNIEYEYEQYRFRLSSNTVYIPDFFLSSWNTFVEIKGNYLNRGSIQKVECFRKDNLGNIIVVRDKEYHQLKEELRKIIPNWDQRG
ncbi:MAG: hypothetical protein ABIC57_01555 [bacterium]